LHRRTPHSKLPGRFRPLSKSALPEHFGNGGLDRFQPPMYSLLVISWLASCDVEIARFDRISVVAH
jgi:hypothetical protein